MTHYDWGRPNNDGLLDIAVDDQQAYVLFENQSTYTGNWLSVEFEGLDNNYMGFGNKVWVTVDDQLIAYREYSGASGGLRSFGCGPLHIGIGEHEAVDIKVRWLNGFEASLFDVPANQALTITDQ